MADHRFAMMTMLVWMLALTWGMSNSSIAREQLPADPEGSGLERQNSLTKLSERTKRAVLIEPIINREDLEGKEEDYLLPISSKGNVWYEMMSYMVKHTFPGKNGMTAVVMPPCNSMGTCMSPVARPLRRNELFPVLCKYELHHST